MNTNSTPMITSLLNDLQSSDMVLVTYKTKTGTTRVMGCTKMLSAVPEELHEGRFDRQLNREDIVCVYDYQNSAWRSFRHDSVISYTVQE